MIEATSPCTMGGNGKALLYTDHLEPSNLATTGTFASVKQGHNREVRMIQIQFTNSKYS